MRRLIHFFFLTALLCVVTATVAAGPTGDGKKKKELVVVILTAGGEITGELEREGDWEVVVISDIGPVTIDRDDIDFMVKGDAATLYKYKAKKADPGKEGDQYRLAIWCKRFYPEKKEKHLENVLKLNPEHIGARDELGQYKWEGKWLGWEEFNKARGYVEYEGKWYPPEVVERLEAGLVQYRGRWVTPGQLERIKKGVEELGDAPSGSSEPEARKIEIPHDLEGLVSTLEKGSRAEVAKAAEEISKRDGGSALLAQELQRLLEKKEVAVREYVKRNRKSICKEMYPRLEAARKAALACIFDKSRYPEENHGRAGQPEVDKLVDQVRLYWERPLDYCIEKKDALREKWDDLVAFLEVYNKYASRRLAEKSLRLRLGNECSEIVDMRKRCTPRDFFEILDYNKKVKTQMSEPEMEVVDITNEYRIMMGRKPLKYHDKLAKTARDHCQSMRDNNFFSHTCPVHGGPAARCRAHGAPYSGENIARGQRTPFGAFSGWYNSSGHHRNMLGRHTYLGVGKVGTFWTQEFG